MKGVSRPNRPANVPTYSDPISYFFVLDQDGKNALEKAGKVRITENKSKKIEDVVNWYVAKKATERNACTNSEIMSVIRAINQSTESLYELLVGFSQRKQCVDGAQYIISKHIPSVIEYYRADLIDRNDITCKLLSDGAQCQDEDLFRYEDLQNTCLMLSKTTEHILIENSVSDFDDVGGDNPQMPERYLLNELIEIFHQLGAKESKISDFVISCINLISEEFMPNISLKKTSLKKRIKEQDAYKRLFLN